MSSQILVLTCTFTMPEGFDSCVEQFGWDHVVSMLISNMELSHSSFHQMKHFHEAMDIALEQ